MDCRLISHASCAELSSVVPTVDESVQQDSYHLPQPPFNLPTGMFNPTLDSVSIGSLPSIIADPHFLAKSDTAVSTSDAVVQSVMDSAGFQTVSRRKKKVKQKLVIGSGITPTSLRSLHSSDHQRTASVFVSRLPPTATVEDLTEFVNSVFCTTATCTKLVTGRSHSSFKVTVSA